MGTELADATASLNPCLSVLWFVKHSSGSLGLFP